MSEKPMYKKPDKFCPQCKGKGYIIEEKIGYGDKYNTYYDRIRCECTFRPTKEYQKLLKKLKKFYDNNKDYDTKIYEYTNPF
jgi:hypothetical protein